MQAPVGSRLLTVLPGIVKLFIMPTPFMHLDIAEKMLAALDEGSVFNGRLRTAICNQWPAFYLGNIAPDFQIVSNLPRVESHFYPIPPDADADAFGSMLMQYPTLQNVNDLDQEHAVFVAAYGAHLLLDLIWFHEILIPYFVKPSDLGDRKQRTLLHFTVLAYLDQMSYESLPKSASATLFSAQSKDWLPFGEQDALIEWRDMVANQLVPGNEIETAVIFAGRLDMPPEEFAANLASDTWMDSHIFRQIPVANIQEILNTAVSRSIQLLSDYLYPNK